MSERPFISQFSPQRTDPDKLEELLVQRHHVLAEAVKRVRDSVLTPSKHHMIFVGPRGIGKTHLVTLVHHRLAQQKDLQGKMRIAWLSEDETATTFLKLLVQIYRSLVERYPNEFSEDELSQIYGRDPESARKSFEEVMLKQLGKRTLVLIMENMDLVFRDMGEGELRTWRAFLQNNPVITTVGTAQSLFAGISSQKEPFYGFFDVRHLEAFTVNDALELLKKIAIMNGRDEGDELVKFLSTPKGRARVQAVHRLAGGNPRIYLVFSEFLTRDSLDDLVRPFEELADRQLTSYYQERLRWLSPQQREIVLHLCRQRHPVPVKHISEQLFAKHGSITNQLKLLREMRYVNGHERGREVLYELAEPLMRLSLQIKETSNHAPLRLIVDFLRVWYDGCDLEKKLILVREGSLEFQYLREAVNLHQKEPNLRHIIWREMLTSINFTEYDESHMQTLRVLVDESDEISDFISLALATVARKDYGKLVEVASRMMAHHKCDEAVSAIAHGMRAEAYASFDRNREAVDDLNVVLESQLLSPRHMALFLLQRGAAYSNLQEYELAVGDFTSALKLGVALEDKSSVYARRGLSNQALGRSKRSIQDFTLAIKYIAEDDVMLDDLHRVRGFCYVIEGEIEKAMSDLNMVKNSKTFTKSQLSILRFNMLLILAEAGKQELLVNLCDEDFLSVFKGKRYSEALLLRASAKDVLGRYGDSLADVEKLLAMKAESSAEFFYDGEVGVSEICRLLVTSIFKIGLDTDKWVVSAEYCLAYLSKVGWLRNFGDALVRHIPELAGIQSEYLSSETWLRGWEMSLKFMDENDRSSLEIPLRILRAGISYQSSKDVASLLALPAEERDILREVLGLAPETM